MKFLLNFCCLLLCLSVYGQDSTKQKHPLFKVSGVSIIGGRSIRTDIQNNNQTNVSPQSLLSIWPEFATKPFANYAPVNSQNYNGGNNNGMFGVYLSFDNYNKKKNRYAIHSQTNIGISVLNQSNLWADYSNTVVTQLQTLFAASGSSLYPAYYKVYETTTQGNVNYQSTNMGLDVQQVFTTNQKKILSFYIGLGASANFSTLSQILYSQNQYKEIYLSTATPPNYNYQYNNPYYNITPTSTTSNDSLEGTGHNKIKGSGLYQIYIPLGFNIRLGKNDKKIISHIYLVYQLRVGIQILKIQSVNAFVFGSSYETFGVKYKF